MCVPSLSYVPTPISHLPPPSPHHRLDSHSQAGYGVAMEKTLVAILALLVATVVLFVGFYVPAEPDLAPSKAVTMTLFP